MAKNRRKKKRTGPWTERLGSLRTRMGWTQEEAAAKVGVSRRAWAAWEGGEQLPTPSHAILLAALEKNPGNF